MLKRYRHWLGEEARHMVETFDGEYVLYEDHFAAIEEKDKEIEHLKEELKWKETGGVDRITGKAWLTKRMEFEAKILELTMNMAEKDKEIEQLEAENDNMRKIFDGLMAILPPEYFVKEDGDG